MNLTTWDSSNYQELINYLNSKKDLKYQEFQKKIINYDQIIGVKMEELKKISKEIAKGDYNTFIKLNNSNYHETIMIEGFLYGYLKLDINTILEYLDAYQDKITSWAQVDSCCSNLKLFKKKENQEIGFKYAKKLLKSKNNFSKRFGLIILLNYYLHDIYIDKTLELVSNLKTDDYYVSMAISWLIASSYIKYQEKTLIYLVNIKNDFIYNKAISKIIDSRQISKKEKDFVKTLKRNTKNN